MSKPSVHEGFKFYHYDPSYAANVVFAILFAVPAIGHIYLLIKRRTWYFIPFIIGTLFEAIGYAARAASAKETPDWTLTPYMVQTLLILLGPALYAASIYMVLGRLIRLLEAEKHSVIRTKWLTKIFVLGDVLSFLTQSGGGGLLAKAKSQSEVDAGNNIVLAGLGIQVIFFGLFMATTVVFHVRINKNPTSRSFSVTVPWRRFIMTLYFSSVLILVRSLFRMAEFGLGNSSVLMSSEVYLFAFDGALMFLVTVVFLWYHPARIFIWYNSVGTQRDVESRGESIAMVLPTSGRQPKTYESDTTDTPLGRPLYDGPAPKYSSRRYSTAIPR